jgi:hypothetical protein
MEGKVKKDKSKSKKKVREGEPTREIFDPKKRIPVKKFARFKSTRIQTAINVFEDGNVFLDIRQWYTSNKFKDGEYRPTGKGLSIHVRDIDDLEAAVAKAKRLIKKHKIKTIDPPDDNDYD